MPKNVKKLIEVEGVVKEVLPNATFRVEISVGAKKHEIEGYLSGKMRKFSIRIMPGDRVKMLISPYEPSRARITYRTMNRT